MRAAVIVLFPFVWIAAAAFKTQIALLHGRGAVHARRWPTSTSSCSRRTPTTSRNFRNSLIVGVGSTALVLVVATLAAYSIDRMRWPRWVVHGFLLVAAVFHMIPPITMVGAWYVMFRAVGLYNTYAGLILAHVDAATCRSASG